MSAVEQEELAKEEYDHVLDELRHQEGVTD
jgi:hypothetical protein